MSKDIEAIRQGFTDPVPSVSTLMAEIEQLKEELAISAQAVGVSEWRRQECVRLRAALNDILGTAKFSQCIDIAREALKEEP